jgi:hypothetical protein
LSGLARKANWARLTEMATLFSVHRHFENIYSNYWILRSTRTKTSLGKDTLAIQQVWASPELKKYNCNEALLFL